MAIQQADEGAKVKSNPGKSTPSRQKWREEARSSLLPLEEANARRVPGGKGVCQRRPESISQAGMQRSFPPITCEPFGQSKKGERIDLFTLPGPNGMEARISNYGGTVVSLLAPDREGRLADVVLGYDTLGKYLKDTSFFGALIGRFGNRIAQGQFTLGTKVYQLPLNDPPNSLHGGRGFDKVVWQARPVASEAGNSLQLNYLSPDGEEGYPGDLRVTATYALTARQELRLDFRAVSNQDTIINLTQHTYFNLAGAGAGTILNHEVTIHADRVTIINKNLIPTGELRLVAGTPFDFRSPMPIGARIDARHQQLTFAKGYDHNYVINKKRPAQLSKQARVFEPTTGRVLEVLSTEPGLQFYSGNFLTAKIRGKGGRSYPFRSGFCMEPQHFPDSPNHPDFPSVLLRAGATFKSTIIYRFSAKK